MTVKRKNSAPKQQSQNLVINNITIQPVPRNTADIDTWRSALKAADRGKRKALYNLYEDLMLDPILSDAIDKRIEAITNAELVFKSQNGEAVAEIDDLMDTPEFEDMLEQMEKEHGSSIVLRCKTGITRIALKQLEYCEVIHRTLLIHLTDGTVYECNGSMDELGRQLMPYGTFIRPHRSYLVNLEYIKNLSYRTITMSSLVEIPVPRGKYNEIKSAFLKNAFEDGQVTL